MRQIDLNRVVFHSKEDLSSVHYLQIGEPILKADVKSDYTDINEILELYNLKKYIDNELFLKNWTEDDIKEFKQKAVDYGKTIGKFTATVNDNNVVVFYGNLLSDYIRSFWEVVNNYRVFNRISKLNFENILANEPHTVHHILIYKGLVDYYDQELKAFMLTYSRSAEILLSFYEIRGDDLQKTENFLPRSLTVEDKETILSNYLDCDDVNLNYIGIIQHVRNRGDFRVADKTRLKAKRLYKMEAEKIFSKGDGAKYGITINFPENAAHIREQGVDQDLTVHYSYSLDFIKKNNTPYLLFSNFRILFDFLDSQHRIDLVSKKNKMDVLEKIMGIHSHNEYRIGLEFKRSEIISRGQIFCYKKVLEDLGVSLESVLHEVFTKSFQEKYDFPVNAHLSIPSASSYFENVRFLAPEFESILKQFKLFVEDGCIDLELLQISSSPSAIKDIPSLNRGKYIYLNEDCREVMTCVNLCFSDQSSINHVGRFVNKHFKSFVDLIVHEEVGYIDYMDHQKPGIDYLVQNGLIKIDMNGVIRIANLSRLLILKDLFYNEVTSFHRYSPELQREAQQMEISDFIIRDSSLFSKPEQAYFNFFLNKSEFTNGLDLRNSYLHGTQATQNEVQKHEYAYFTYLKLLVLAILKIEDDLMIHKAVQALNIV